MEVFSSWRGENTNERNGQNVISHRLTSSAVGLSGEESTSELMQRGVQMTQPGSVHNSKTMVLVESRGILQDQTSCVLRRSEPRGTPKRCALCVFGSDKTKTDGLLSKAASRLSETQ